ncbi:MAG: hypothetical protein QM270_11430 [Bacillota bacterium]|nr:hypothetical protein [Bacillota bacterium]
MAQKLQLSARLYARQECREAGEHVKKTAGNGRKAAGGLLVVKTRRNPKDNLDYSPS